MQGQIIISSITKFWYKVKRIRQVIYFMSIKEKLKIFNPQNNNVHEPAFSRKLGTEKDSLKK